MADVNYSNPASFLPQVKSDIAPPAWAAAQQNWDQMKAFKDANSLQQLSTMMANQKQSGELQDYFQTRDSTNQATIAGNQAKTATVMDQLRGAANQSLGQGQVDMAKGQEAQGTVVSNIATKIAENAVKQGDAGVAQARNGLKMAAIMNRIPGPQAAAQAPQIAAQLGVTDPNLIKMIATDPKTAMQILQATDEKFQNDTSLAEQKGRLEKDKDTSVANIQAGSAAKVAGITAGAHIQAATIAAEATKGTDQQFARLVDQVSARRKAGQPDDPVLMDQLKYVAGMKATLATLSARQNQAMTESATNGAITAPAAVTAPDYPGTVKASGIKVGDMIPGTKIQVKSINPDGTVLGSDGQKYRPKG